MARPKGPPWFSSWILEILAVALSFTSLITIFALIGYHDGKPIITWHEVTLNTGVSALSSIARSATALSVTSCLGQFRWIQFKKGPRPLSDFETISGAARGPWGGLRLLWRTRSL
jgi:hypothetical protein